MIAGQVKLDGTVEIKVSGDVNVNLKLSPELEAFLKQLIPEKQVTQEITKQTKSESKKQELVKAPEEKKTMNNSLTSEKKQVKKPVPEEPDWIDGPNGMKMKYRTDVITGKLFIKYFTGVAETTWDKMIKLSNVPQKMRKSAISNALATPTRNKETAVTLFISCLENNSIRPPENYLSFITSIPNVSEEMSAN